MRELSLMPRASRGRTQVPIHEHARGAPREAGDAGPPACCQRVAFWGTLAQALSPHLRRGWGERQALSVLPAPVSGRGMKPLCLGPDRSALSVGRKGGKLWEAPPLANLWDGWTGAGWWGGDPPGAHGPFHGARPSQVTAGSAEGQDRPGHNRCSVLTAPGPHAHTCTNTQPYANPRHTPSHPRTGTHVSRRLCHPGHPPTYRLSGRETQTCGILPAPPTYPPGPLGHCAPHPC